jgi:protein involved in polysaccharide export with SLBB domain
VIKSNTQRKIVCLFLALSFFSGLFLPGRLSAQNPDYKIQPTDVLNIAVFQQPDLTTKARVSADGYISFPLLGKVYVKDLSADEVAQKLKEMLEKDYLVSAQVSVFVEQYHPRQVTVLGEVIKPGKYNMPTEKKITLMEAIALAGGFTKDAALNNTTVLRTENGKEKIIKVKVKDITIKGQKQDDVVLEPGDIVNVPESFF